MYIWHIWWLWSLYGAGLILWARYIPLIPTWLRYTLGIFGAVQIVVNVVYGVILR